MKNLLAILLVSSLTLACSENTETNIPDTSVIPAISKSDDYDKYSSAFLISTKTLVLSRTCSLEEISELGGWMKSVTNHKDQPVYFIYCGGNHRSNRIYLNAESGEIFR